MSWRERERVGEREREKGREGEQVRKREGHKNLPIEHVLLPPPSPSTTLLPILHVLITAGTELDHKPSDMELGAKLRLPGKRRLALGLRPAGRPPLPIPPLLQAAQSLLPCKRERDRHGRRICSQVSRSGIFCLRLLAYFQPARWAM